MMMVVAIVGIIAAVAYPSFKSMKQENALYSAARQIMSDYRHIQQLAVNEQTAYSLTFNADSDGYTVSSASDTVKTVRIESGIYFDSANSSGITGGKFDVTTDGFPGGGIKKIALRNNAGKYIYVYIRPAGKVEILWE